MPCPNYRPGGSRRHRSSCCIDITCNRNWPPNSTERYSMRQRSTRRLCMASTMRATRCGGNANNNATSGTGNCCCCVIRHTDCAKADGALCCRGPRANAWFDNIDEMSDIANSSNITLLEITIRCRDATLPDGWRRSSEPDAQSDQD